MSVTAVLSPHILISSSLIIHCFTPLLHFSSFNSSFYLVLSYISFLSLLFVSVLSPYHHLSPLSRPPTPCFLRASFVFIRTLLPPGSGILVSNERQTTSFCRLFDITVSGCAMCVTLFLRRQRGSQSIFQSITTLGIEEKIARQTGTEE